jgi:hypothetical protein
VDSVFHFPVLELVSLTVEFTARFPWLHVKWNQGALPLFVNFFLARFPWLLFIAEHPICNPLFLVDEYMWPIWFHPSRVKCHESGTTGAWVQGDMILAGSRISIAASDLATKCQNDFVARSRGPS